MIARNGIRVMLMAAVLGSGLALTACSDGHPGYYGRYHDRYYDGYDRYDRYNRYDRDYDRYYHRRY